MRAHLAALSGLALTVSLLAGCGDERGATASDPEASEPSTTTSASGDSPSASPSAKLVSVQRTCAELYHPPAQLMPRAIELVHGSPSAEDASGAAEIVTGVAGVERHSLGPLAEDIAVVRATVEAQAEDGSVSDGARLKEFDAAVNRLARHCVFYMD